jgi:ABC-type nickel/cobalt efflux system permease component RcnA
MNRLGLVAALIVALVGFAIASTPRSADAHPLGNFSINRLSILDLDSSGTVALRYIVDSAEIPAFQALRVIDVDRDGSVSQSEEATFLASEAPRLLGKLTLQVDGRDVRFNPTVSSLELLPGQGGLQTLRVVIDAEAALPQAWTQGTSASFHDGNYEGQAGWRQVVVRPSAGVNLFESSVSMVDQTAELTVYPEDLLKSPPNQGSADFSFRPGETLMVPVLPQGETVARDSANKTLGRFASLVSRENLTPSFVVLALLLAAGWGAMHALGPGHGKTVVAAYLVGERGTGRHALFLGLVVTATHTISVFALGGIAVFASQVLSADDIYAYLSLASGVVVLALGGGLLVTRLRRLQGSSEHAGDYGHEHHHDELEHNHDHGHEHPHVHQDDHHHGHSHVPTAPGWRGLVALGVSGGLVPCPTALVVMLGAIAIDRAAYGMVLVTAFSFGLAGVLTGVGLLLVYGQRLLKGPVARMSFLNSGLVVRLQAVAPVLSALGIIGAGVLLTGQAML